MTDIGNTSFKETNAGGQGRVTVDAAATKALMDCITSAGEGAAPVALKPSGTTRARNNLCINYTMLDNDNNSRIFC